jgi:hypothetical protein
MAHNLPFDLVRLLVRRTPAKARTDLLFIVKWLVAAAFNPWDVHAWSSMDCQPPTHTFFAYLATTRRGATSPHVLGLVSVYDRISFVCAVLVLYATMSVSVYDDHASDRICCVPEWSHSREMWANCDCSGPPAWEEFNWVGRTIQIGDATLQVEKRTVRCDATNVDGRNGSGKVSAAFTLFLLYSSCSTFLFKLPNLRDMLRQ